MLDLLNLLADDFTSILTSDDCLENWIHWFNLPVNLYQKLKLAFVLNLQITDLFQRSFMPFFDNLPQFVYDLDV